MPQNIKSFASNFVGTNKQLQAEILSLYNKRMSLEAVKKLRQRSQKNKQHITIRFTLGSDTAIAHVVGTDIWGSLPVQGVRDMVGTLMGGGGEVDELPPAALHPQDQPILNKKPPL